MINPFAVSRSTFTPQKNTSLVLAVIPGRSVDELGRPTSALYCDFTCWATVSISEHTFSHTGIHGASDDEGLNQTQTYNVRGLGKARERFLICVI